MYDPKLRENILTSDIMLKFGLQIPQEKASELKTFPTPLQFLLSVLCAFLLNGPAAVDAFFKHIIAL